VNVAVLLDRSQSVSDRFPFLSASAAAFERSVLRDRNDQGMVVAFDSKVYLLQGWTADAATLAESIRTLTPAGGTSIFDAIFKTCRDRFDIVDARQNVIVLITDGEDTTSVATFDQALEMATLSRVVVYVIGIRAESSMNTRELQGRRVLSSLATLTGGRVFYPDEQRQQEIGTLLAQVQEELRSAYSLTYYLDVAPDNSFHRVRIEARNKSFTVHGPTGYYARALPPIR
jgi:Ca-activated chloride channel family protein